MLGVLTAAWPDKDLPRETVELWLGMLAGLDYSDAKDAALDIVRQDQWFPSIARFLQQAEVHAHGRRNRMAAERGIEPSHRSVPPPPELLEASHRLLSEMGGTQHDHHGPRPCPKCGGGPLPWERKKPEGKRGA